MGLCVLVVRKHPSRPFEECLWLLWGQPSSPLAHVHDEGEVVHELLIDEEVPALVVPQEIRPLAVQLLAELRLTPAAGQQLLESRLEHLELRERLPTRVHLDVEVVARLHIVDWQEQERDRHIARRGKSLPESCEVMVIAGKAFVDCPDHHQHRLDGWVCTPGKQVPGLVDDPFDGISFGCRPSVGNKLATEVLGAQAGGVPELGPWCTRIQRLGAGSDIPVQEEQGG